MLLGGTTPETLLTPNRGTSVIVAVLPTNSTISDCGAIYTFFMSFFFYFSV